MKSSLIARSMIGAGIALGGALVMYGAWRMTRDDAAPPSPAPAAVDTAPSAQAVVAARPIKRGQTISAADLGVIRIAGAAPAGVLPAPGIAVGRIAIVDYAPNQFVLASGVATNPGQAGLAALVPPGYRAISTDVTEEIAVANHLRPGDIVDIQIVLPASVIRPAGTGPDASEARTLLENIRVLAIGSGDVADPNAPAGGRVGRTLTLAMTPAQVSEFALARSLGRFYLTLRNPADLTPGAGVARVSDLRGGVSGAPVVRRQTYAPRPRPAAPSIELIVAGQREVLRPGGAP